MGRFYEETGLGKESLIDDWWDQLEYQEQIEVVSNVYPDEIISDEEDMWNRLDFKVRWQIFSDWNNDDG